MQDQRIEGSIWLPEPDEVARVILGLVMQRHPALVEVAELVRELSHPSLQQRIGEPLLHDGLVDLASSGLVHRLDNFVFATRTAMRASDLAL